MSDAGSFVGLVDRILGGEAPRQIRSAAARGALPLPRPVLVRLYLALREDEDEEIRTDASNSLAGLEPEAVTDVLGDADCPVEVLGHFAAEAARNEAWAEKIAFHGRATPEMMSALAAKGTARVIDLVLTNEERLLRQPDLLDRLSVNPALRADQRGRLLELIERALKLRSRTAGQGAEADEAGEPDASPEFEEAARLLQVEVGELFARSEIIDGEEFEESDDERLRGAYHRILQLNTAQKAVLALRGGREERMILARDSNKLVSLGVLRNPRINEDEIESLARMRNVPSDLLRVIGQTREWTKSYTVVHALVLNPRTPQGISSNFIPRLQNQALKQLARNHDVPELIRRMAKRTLDQRTSKRR